LDVDSDLRITDELGTEPGPDHAFDFGRRVTPHAERTDQRHGDAAIVVDRIGARQVWLAVNKNAQPISSIEKVRSIAA
jgi:hypothetical protein